MTTPIHYTDLLTELEAFEPDKATNREKLELAQQALELAVNLTEEVAKATDDGHAEAYLVDHLKIMARANHGYLSRDFNMDAWLERIDRAEGDEDG